ncbi:hypothetical protein OHA20_20680 [Streptomyces sp. NBC_01579]
MRTQGARGRRLVAFFGCMYYAAARPAEVIGLCVEDCDLPRRGWGVLRLRETRPRSGSAWTDSGTAHDRRGLKHRPRKSVRTVPIPPDLVALLRWHIVAYGVTPDGRLFRTQRGGLVQDTGYGEVWAEARLRALTPTQRSSSPAKRPYDLRHAAVSAWLSSGVEPQVVAQRAGHSWPYCSASSPSVWMVPRRRRTPGSKRPCGAEGSPLNTAPRLPHTSWSPREI